MPNNKNETHRNTNGGKSRSGQGRNSSKRNRNGSGMSAVARQQNTGAKFNQAEQPVVRQPVPTKPDAVKTKVPDSEKNPATPVTVRLEMDQTAADGGKAVKTDGHLTRRRVAGFSGRMLKKAVFSDNPLLLRALGIATVLGAAVSLKNGLLLSMASVLVSVPFYFIATLLYKRLPEPYRSVSMWLIAGIIVTPVCMLSHFIAPEVTSAVGIFLPLTAVNAVLMYYPKTYRSGNRYLNSLIVGLRDSVGFSVIVVIISVLREIIGGGSIYGRQLPGIYHFKINLFLLPPGAFLLLGFIFAAVQAYHIHSNGIKNNGGAR